MVNLAMDLIRTIEDDDEIQGQSEDSDVEVDYQPTKQKRQIKDDFDGGFEFVSSVAQYNHDTWDDLMKFVKRRTRGKVDDKIAKVISNRKQETTEKLAESDEEFDLEAKKKRVDEEVDFSDDELKHDNIRVKQRKGKKGKKFNLIDENPEENEKMQFDESVENKGDENVNSFYQMNLSRPLMKAIGVLGYIYPTPIQASTIPLALLGRDICGCAATGKIF